MAAVNAALEDAMTRDQRVILGFDFGFGYPKGLAEALTGSPDALALWDWLAERIEDGADNANNRFDVAENIDEFLSIDDGGWDFIMGHLNETPTVDEMYSVLDQLERATFCQHNGRFFVVMMIF